VEDVVAHRRTHGQRRFLVRYKGFGPSFDEWEREEDVSEQLVKDMTSYAVWLLLKTRRRVATTPRVMVTPI
jgi:hypothetical protein